jgi:hypothetical protein
MNLHNLLVLFPLSSDYASVPIMSTYVSRVHANILFYRGRWTISDRSSLNGTFLNNSKLDVNDYYTLNVGDRICLGVPWNDYKNNVDKVQYDPEFYVFRLGRGTPFNMANMAHSAFPDPNDIDVRII